MLVVVVVLVLTGTWPGAIPVSAQSELDTLMENAENTDKPEVAIPETGAASDVDAAWFSAQITAAEASEEEKKWAEQLRKIAAVKGEQQIADMKKLILEKFKISIMEGQIDGGPESYQKETAGWKGKAWQIDQLQTIYDTLDGLPEFFTCRTKRISKFQAEMIPTGEGKDQKYVPEETFGRVLSDLPDTVNLFDVMFDDKRYSSKATGQAKLSATLVHEMTHCFQYCKEKNGPGRTGEFSDKFWVKVVKYTQEDGYPVPESETPPNFVSWFDFSKEGYYERGFTVSRYGGPGQRLMYGGWGTESDPRYVGAEDFAESTSFAVCAPELMKSRFPERYGWISSFVLDFHKKKKPVPAIESNPRWYGFSETEIYHAPPNRKDRRHWADVGAGGSKMESWPEVFLAVNIGKNEVNQLNDTTAVPLKGFAEFPEVK
jgi:hypothetical protein